MRFKRLLLLLFLLLLPAGTLFCSEPVVAGATPSAEELDKAIQEVIRQREYQWRMPRDVVEEEEQSLLFDFLEGMSNTIQRAWKPIADLWGKITRWLRKMLSPPGSAGTGKEWTAGELNLLILILSGALILLVLFFVWRHRKRKRATEVIIAEAIHPMPDISDENVVADQLPEEGWQRLAQDLLARGELRLAVRAMFMATLAHLAEARLISIARFKSNREYLRELSRRAYEQKPLQEAFHQNVSAVDSVWYGMHPVTDDLLNRFKGNVEIVKRAVA